MNCHLCGSCTIASMRDGVLFCGSRWWQLLGSDQLRAEDEHRARNRQQISELEETLRID